MDEPPAGVEYETREVGFEVKPHQWMYDPQVIDHLKGEAEMAGEPHSITYACDHTLVQSDLKPTPATCPDCGAMLHE